MSLSTQTPTTYTFHTHGMHCPSCSVLIEHELRRVPGITNVSPSLAHHTVTVTGNFEQQTAEHIADTLSIVLTPHGYSLAIEKSAPVRRWTEFAYAVPIASIFILLFFLLEKIGLVQFVQAENIGYGTALILGIVASVSTCMAVVGGLVLSLSASEAKGGSTIRPQVLFHGSRLVSFFLLGGVIGALGSVFTLGATGTFIMGIFVALVLIVLGINLLDVIPHAKKLQPRLPRVFGTYAYKLVHMRHTLTPVLLGAATFFLPCGFTQSMQLYTLASGNFWTGAWTMFAFAVGTLPVLAILSFGSFGMRSKRQSGIFFKSAGLVVVFFGVYNLITSMVLIGLIPPIF